MSQPCRLAELRHPSFQNHEKEIPAVKATCPVGSVWQTTLLVFSGVGVSVWSNKTVPEIDGGDGHRTMQMHLMPPAPYTKNSENSNCLRACNQWLKQEDSQFKHGLGNLAA